MKQIISITSFLIVVLVSGSLHAQSITWSTTTDYDHNCLIQFPGVPTNVHKNTSEGTKYTSYAIYGQSSYFLKVLDLKTEPADKKAKALKVLNTLAAKARGTVTEKIDWIERGVTGVKGKFEMAEAGKPEMLVYCYVIVIDKIQYEIIMMSPKEIYDPEFDGHFLGSFRFLN
ncbi:MAG: hypothetical protein P8H56_10530 [Crocinitomicaceae bacterium]|nr:hypothetical protein [Crocinitomicaceae bacterium]MDG1659010.1 hypothetical protein [Crocinitomicaceae bacterium]